MHKLLMGDGIYVHKNTHNYDNRRCNLVNIRGYKNNGKTYLNGYIAIYFPEHPRAFDNGCVYEHLLVAEKMLNRPLSNEECVHHIDLNRTNNKEENLMIFATESDHISYHNGATAILQDNGNYICEKSNINYYEYVNRTKTEINNNIEDIGSIIIIKNKAKFNLCPNCRKNVKYIKAKMCKECYDKNRIKIRPSKETLLKDLCEKKNFDLLAEQYGVTESAIRKWCKGYGLPYKRKGLQVAISNLSA